MARYVQCRYCKKAAWLYITTEPSGRWNGPNSSGSLVCLDHIIDAEQVETILSTDLATAVTYRHRIPMEAYR